MKKNILPLFGLMMAFLFLPGVTKAYDGTETVDLVSITPDAADLSAFSEGGDQPEGVDIFSYSGTVGETYTAVYSVSEQPVMVVITGGTMEGWSYDATAKTITVVTEHTGYIEGSEYFGPYSPFGIAVVWASEDYEQDAPPTDMTGSWMATNLMNWQLIPPSDDEEGGSPYFGYSLSGPDGETGFFQMFMTDGTKDMLSELADQELEWQDLAVFLDDDQASMSITETDGGALIDIEITFDDNTTQISSLAASTDSSASVTKTVKVQEQDPVSFACKSYRKSKGSNFTCFGWVKNATKGQKVRIMRKALGKKTWKQHKVTTIKNSNGYFKVRLQMKKKTASYKAYSVKKKKYSSVKKVRITK